MRLSRNNKGTSLIELVIAMAIAAVVISMIMFFVNVAAKSFRKTSDDVNLQMEAQTTINQISNIAMEAKDLDIYPADGEIDPVTGDIRYTFWCNHNEFYTFIFVKADKKLYQVQTTSFELAHTVTYNMQEHFLAEYVKDLVITKNNKSVTINLTLTLGEDEYQISKSINMRNAK